MTELEKKQLEYLSKKRVLDAVIELIRLLKKHEPWKEPSLVARCKEIGIDLEKLGSVI